MFILRLTGNAKYSEFTVEDLKPNHCFNSFFVSMRFRLQICFKGLRFKFQSVHEIIMMSLESSRNKVRRCIVFAISELRGEAAWIKFMKDNPTSGHSMQRLVRCVEV